jgi:hypothetical protein
MLNATTVNRYLRQWGYDHETLRRQPAAVRFQAEHSNDCCQFDLSPSDLKEVKEPLWLQPNKGAPTLMLFSVVDDRSGGGLPRIPLCLWRGRGSGFAIFVQLNGAEANRRLPVSWHSENDLH